MNGFWTLLGGDYAGKSETLRRLARDGWQVVSYDDPYVRDFPVVRRLRSGLFFEAFRRVGRPYPAPLAFSLLTPIVWYLREEALRSARRGPTIVDSYYLKLLAKGIVTGIADPATAALWRSFPPPQGVVYLDVEPAVAWERSGGAGRLNPFEHHGSEPTRDGFVGFQRDLRSVLLHEIADLDVRLVDANQPPEAVATRVREALGAGAQAALAAAG
jgi:hypothetical protein